MTIVLRTFVTANKNDGTLHMLTLTLRLRCTKKLSDYEFVTASSICPIRTANVHPNRTNHFHQQATPND